MRTHLVISLVFTGFLHIASTARTSSISVQNTNITFVPVPAEDIKNSLDRWNLEVNNLEVEYRRIVNWPELEELNDLDPDRRRRKDDWKVAEFEEFVIKKSERPITAAAAHRHVDSPHEIPPDFVVRIFLNRNKHIVVYDLFHGAWNNHQTKIAIHEQVLRFVLQHTDETGKNTPRFVAVSVANGDDAWLLNKLNMVQKYLFKTRLNSIARGYDPFDLFLVGLTGCAAVSRMLDGDVREFDVMAVKSLRFKRLDEASSATQWVGMSIGKANLRRAGDVAGFLGPVV